MYYEERWIDGKFCWRTSPNGAWTAYTANELAHRYQAELQRAHDLQRALDAEREKVKELEEGKGYLIRLWGLVASQCEILPTLVGLATQFDNYIAGQNHELTTLQAQLRQVEGERDRLRRALEQVSFHLAQPGDDETPHNQYVPSAAEVGTCQVIILAALTPAAGE